MGLADKKQELSIMEKEFNIKRQEVRLLEIDEEKEKIQENIDRFRTELADLKETLGRGEE